ncbi:metallopeptidase [Planctellipticum variicoloris]|uniref:metallopeptidase n=1 Tax=Planctellipticum variicoloris TaxID=3064265 RepID=UPI003013D4FE|nr:metallopeptidase [Planctomycetaceae bacterium SH412]
MISTPRWLLLTLGLLAATTAAIADEPARPTTHQSQTIEGWSVRIDQRLLDGESEDVALGRRALRLLGDRLYEIQLVVPADRVEQLRKVTIQLDRTHGKLTSMQYHPSADWLRNNGYSETLARCVHLPDAAGFASPKHHQQQPWAVLHELAHAYHDQVLDFEHAEIKAAWERFRDGGKYEKVLHIDGGNRRHYALTNQKEFFAEMSEAYFGLNDFYPFHRAELQRDEPELFKLLHEIWGPPVSE